MKDQKIEDPHRRQFLKGAGAVAASTLAATSSGASTEAARRRRDVDYDVVIIGGGFAGVTAARDCMNQGLSCLILEARGRMGGRALTAAFGNDDVELGGTWIHWTQPFIWAERERYGLDVVETPGASPERIVLLMDGQRQELTEADFGAVMAAFTAVTADARAILSQPYDPASTWDRVREADQISVRQHLDRSGLTKLQRTCLESVFATAAHCRLEDWSYLELLRWTALAGFNDFLLFLDASARFKLKDGTSRLIDAMLKDGGADVRLSAVVRLVEDAGSHVNVVTADGTTKAGAVVCTVPMNVLPDIEFKPALSNAVIEAGRERHNGKGFKVFAQARGDLGSVFCFADTRHAVTNLLTYKTGSDHTLLVGFGIDRDALDVNDKDAVESAFREYLPDLQIDNIFSYDWVADPYSKGTWASYKPGWMEKYYDKFQQDSGRILFASGDHGGGWRGFIDGAIAAGSKAAQRANILLS